MFNPETCMIWAENAVEINTYRRFKTEFSADGSGYEIKIHADSNYALYLNGTSVAFGQYPGYEDLRFFDTVNIDKYIKDGENELLIDVYHQGESSSVYRAKNAGLMFEVTRCGEVVCCSNKDVKTCPITAYSFGKTVEKVTEQLGFSFKYDARKQVEVSQYVTSTVHDTPKTILPRPVKKLEILQKTPMNTVIGGDFFETQNGTIGEKIMTAKLYGEKRTECGGITLRKNSDSADGCFAIIDMGREETGMLTLDIDLPNDCEVLIGWGEHLSSGRVRAFVGGRNFACSYYGKKGKNKYFNPFLRLGARYLEVHIYSNTAQLNYVGLTPTEYPLGRAKDFSCSLNLHNEIYNVSLRTLHLCMHEHYEDCPWREQALYMMDSRNQMLCSYLAFGETEFAKASLLLTAHSLREDGLLELCSPAKVPITIPSFTAIFNVALWEYFEASGDLEFLKEMLPTAMTIVDGFLDRTENEYGVLTRFKGPEYWNFYEWQPTLSNSAANGGKMTYDAPLNAFVLAATRSLFYICRALGLQDKFKYYQAKYQNLKNAVNKVFKDKESGIYYDFCFDGECFGKSELTNSLMVFAGAVDGKNTDSVLEALLSGKMIETTLSSKIYLYEALLTKPEKYGKYVFEDIADKWGYMLSCGATTFWETALGEKDFNNAGSLCHGWSAIPIYFYLKYAACLPSEFTGVNMKKAVDGRT